MLKNSLLIILSLLIASIFWLGIVSTQQNIQYLENGIPVKPINVPDNLFISSKTPLISIKIDTSKNLLKNVSLEDFQAFIDFSTAKVGKSTFPINVKSLNSDIRVVSFLPIEVTIDLEEIKEKTFNIKLEYEGEVSDDFIIVKTDMSEEKAILKAGVSVLDKIAEVKAIIILQGEKNNIKKKVKLQAFNEHQELVENLPITPDEIEVNIELSQITDTKIVGIKVPVIGELSKNNFFVNSITISPNITKIRAKKRFLDTITYVQTEPVNLAEISKSNTIITKIITPEETEIIDTKVVRVKVELTEIMPINEMGEIKENTEILNEEVKNTN